MDLKIGFQLMASAMIGNCKDFGQYIHYVEHGTGDMDALGFSGVWDW